MYCMYTLCALYIHTDMHALIPLIYTIVFVVTTKLKDFIIGKTYGPNHYALYQNMLNGTSLMIPVCMERSLTKRWFVHG